MKTAILSLAALLLALQAALHAVEVRDLRCEYLADPLGIDVEKPRLSWMTEVRDQTVEVRGLKQTAYQVLVASTPELLAKDKGDLWDSGKVDSDQSIQVEYGSPSTSLLRQSSGQVRPGKQLESRMQCHWKVRIWDQDGKATDWSPAAAWTMGLLKQEDWQAKWICWQGADTNISPWLRTSFDLPEATTRAQVCVNVIGYAELYVNGSKVGRDVLTPAVSALDRRIFSITYDVAPMLRKGRNVIALWLGRGWAPAAPLVRAQLDAQVAGHAITVGTDATWKGRASSYVSRGKWTFRNFGGERVDARAAVSGWNQPEFDDREWQNVTEVPAPKGAVEAQPAPLNRIGRIIPAVAVTEAGKNQYRIDFGTGLTGWMRLKMPKLAAGTVVRMTFCDVGKQSFNQVSEFVAAGGDGEVFEHKFNYAGFRYVTVEGLPAAPSKDDAQAMLVESDLESVGSFECSNDLFNRIHALTQWTQRCLNLGGYYVDCPHRERMGYGDGQVAAEGFMSNFRADGYYRKWLGDWRMLQTADGKMPNTAPFGGGGGGPAWAGTLAAITWRHYLYYGDPRIVEENIGTVRRYMDWLESRCNDDVLRKYGGKWEFIGDWVPPERGMDTKNWPSPAMAELFNNCYRVYQWELLAKMSAALGRQDEVKRCHDRLAAIRPAIHAAFFDAAKGCYVIDEQAYYLMPLLTGVTPESDRPTVLRNLERCILVKNGGHLDTGMLGTYFLMEHLRMIGRNDLVFTMFKQTTYPGWGNMLEKGATTCWEQWNGSFSQIHSCFTSADNWFYQGPGGIRPDDSAPGFKRILIEPAVVGDLTWVKSSHVSPYGKIVCNWARDGEKVTMNVTIPINTTATVNVPAKDAAAVMESGQPAAKAQGVKWLRMENNAAVYAVGSGTYCFQSTLPATRN